MNQRRAIVTGGSSGIGAEICRRLLAESYEVVSVARQAAAAGSSRLRSVCVDLEDPDAARAAFLSLAGEAPATTLVHCAGAIRERPVEQVTPEDLEALTQLHVGTAIALLQANLAAMRAAHYGRVVLISSRAALGLASRSVYSATKAALIGLARTWALELGPAGVTVNVVAPGPIAETAMFDAIVPAGSPLRTNPAAILPVGRVGTPRDVARAVWFFASPEASFVTGQTLYVCGGTSVGGLAI
ncbi:MAG TPA: SDR family oxidoreductase [Steroidobacteraceae bacterium]|nr:SDR family oxidoreductase [Steroidobacteraceae bacterium]